MSVRDQSQLQSESLIQPPQIISHSSASNQSEARQHRDRVNRSDVESEDESGNRCSGNKDDEGNSLIQPFIIESYNKQERHKQRTNKPKLGLKRLTEDKKLVSVDIDIPLETKGGDGVIIKDKFDWDLSKDKVSPTDFAKQLVSSLNLPEEYAEKISEQILSQIMEHIKANTRQAERENLLSMNEQANQGLNGRMGGNMKFGALNDYQYQYQYQYQDDEFEKQENEKKKMSRMRRNDMKRVTAYIPSHNNRYFKEKKICRNCKNENHTPGYECKHCKLPFQLMEVLNFEDKRVRISAKYYEKIANKIPLLTYEAKKKTIQKEDFDSFYGIYHKIKGIFKSSDELSKEHLNQVRYIMEKYHEYFLNGNLDFNDEDIIYDKDIRRDSKKDDELNRPKRARGRPRKIKIINDDLVPNSSQASADESSGSEECSSDDSSP